MKTKNLIIPTHYCAIKADGEVKWCINFLIESFFCKMFEVKNGEIYYVVDHWKNINWKLESPRARIGKVKLKDGYYYQPEKVK